jgi:hypothetical protein
MSYRNYACRGYLLPATIENAKKLGITREEIDKVFNEIATISPDQSLEDYWDECINEASYDQLELTGWMNDFAFTVFVIHVGSDIDSDDDMVIGGGAFFSFDPAELYTPTALLRFTEKQGMRECYWVDGG